MADLCQQCALNIFGEDIGDLAHLIHGIAGIRLAGVA